MKIAIASGKGGTGKTTLSTNLGSFLAENNDVVLVDLDVEEPNSGLFLKSTLIKKYDKFRMVPEWDLTNCTLCGNCQKVCNFHAVITLKTKVMVFPQLCHGCYACSELCPNNSLPMKQEKMGELKHFKVGKLNFVESRLDVGQEQAVPLISQTLEFVDEKYTKETIKLYDSPPGTSCPVIEATKDADFVILVTEPTPFGFHDLKLAIDTMRVLKKEIGVVVNRYGIGNNDVIDYCEKENIPVIATIPNDRKIAELYSRGELLYDKITEVKKELEKISKFIFDRNIGGNK
ncbi:MAG: ATP-binding protein [Candidatus Delongbacteria bacterium]|nr:ATP-binding protein [Candidatus Delongbacteria bacterium]